MKAQPLKREGSTYKECKPEEADYVALHMHGPFPNRMIPVTINHKLKNTWNWNGNVDKPTLTPSILTTNGEAGHRCHCYVTAGGVEYLTDCTHEFAGQKLELLDVN